MRTIFFNKRFAILVSLLAAVLFLGAGCIQIKTNGGRADGGVFKSPDKGERWEQKVNLLTVEKIPQTIAKVNVLSMTLDPQDSKAIYLATQNDGLIATYDGGGSWFKVSALGNMLINAIAVSPASKCAIYAATANKILKTQDCSRSWQVIYFDSRPEAAVVSLAIDPFNSKIIYAGTSLGDVFKSSDEGKSWMPVGRFRDRIVKILVDSLVSRNVYAATQSNGIYKTKNNGEAWFDLNQGLAAFSESRVFYAMAQDLTQNDTFIFASKYGLLRTENGGESWSRIDLVTPPGAVQIFSLAINPQNSKEIYYGTASTFYKTTKGGEPWITKKLPSSRAASAIIVDPDNPSALYMGVRAIQK